MYRNLIFIDVLNLKKIYIILNKERAYKNRLLFTFYDDKKITCISSD